LSGGGFPGAAAASKSCGRAVRVVASSAGGSHIFLAAAAAKNCGFLGRPVSCHRFVYLHRGLSNVDPHGTPAQDRRIACRTSQTRNDCCSSLHMLPREAFEK